MAWLTASEAIKAYIAERKTPYQLDLEVKDRKPSITPKVGDIVKIKSREWYEKWKNEHDDVMFEYLPKCFTMGMSEYCGSTLPIREKLRGGFLLDNCKDCWVWLPEFFEEIYPVQEVVDTTGLVTDHSHPYQQQWPAFKIQTEHGLKIDTEGKIHAPYSLREEPDTSPKLKQVRTTRFIKLKKP